MDMTQGQQIFGKKGVSKNIKSNWLLIQVKNPTCYAKIKQKTSNISFFNITKIVQILLQKTLSRK